MKKISFAFAFVLLTAFSLFAQQTSPTPPKTDDDVLKISTNLIQVDVTVTDKDGNVVRDLKPEDFEVYENGKRQDITNFSFISVDPQTKPAQTGKPPAVSSNKNSIPIPPGKLKPEQVRRTYALVVDDLGLNFANVQIVQQSLKKFINEQVQEGDLVAIIRTGSGIGALQSFTSDKRQLLAAVERIKWNSQGRSGINIFDPIRTTLREELNGTVKSDGSVRSVAGTAEEKEFQNQTDQFRNDNFSVGTLAALNNIIRGMNELPGRKAVILFSEGFPVKVNRIFEQMKVLADLANRFSVVFYTIDPRGLQNPLMAFADEDIRKVVPDDPGAGRLDADPRDARTTAFRETQMSLQYLAYETGGLPFVNQNSLDKGLRQAVADQSGYYLLGYQPDEETFDPKKNRFNKLEVRLLRPGLKVRYRSGFFGIADEKILNIVQTPQQKLANALSSPFGATEVNLNLYPVYQNDAANGDVVQALIYIDAKDLKFTPTAEGKHKLDFDLLAMTFGDNGVPVDNLFRNYTFDVSERIYRNMLKNGFVYALTVPIKKSGAYQFRVALRDTASNRIGSASQFISVPDFKKRMSLSNLVLDNFTAEEWQKIRLGGSRDQSERSVLLDTTLRQFKSGTILRYDYVVYNPKQSRQITTQLRLIRDGKVIYEEAPAPLKIAGQTDLLRLQSSGALTLGKDLEPGSYILQVIVTDTPANEKSGFATQFVEFEIVP